MPIQLFFFCNFTILRNNPFLIIFYYYLIHGSLISSRKATLSLPLSILQVRYILFTKLEVRTWKTMQEVLTTDRSEVRRRPRSVQSSLRQRFPSTYRLCLVNNLFIFLLVCIYFHEFQGFFKVLYSLFRIVLACQVRTSCQPIRTQNVQVLRTGTDKLNSFVLHSFFVHFFYLLGHVWSDNYPVAYTNWDVGQPDSYNGREDCVQLYVDTGYWSDISCTYTLPFICKRKKCK